MQSIYNRYFEQIVCRVSIDFLFILTFQGFYDHRQYKNGNNLLICYNINNKNFHEIKNTP